MLWLLSFLLLLLAAISLQIKVNKPRGYGIPFLATITQVLWTITLMGGIFLLMEIIILNGLTLPEHKIEAQSRIANLKSIDQQIAIIKKESGDDVVGKTRLFDMLRHRQSEEERLNEAEAKLTFYQSNKWFYPVLINLTYNE